VPWLRQFHSIGAPLLGKGQKIIIIIIVIFITGLHKKPQCCGASVASAAGPFTTKRKPYITPHCMITNESNYLPHHTNALMLHCTYIHRPSTQFTSVTSSINDAIEGNVLHDLTGGRHCRMHTRFRIQLSYLHVQTGSTPVWLVHPRP
jgi:hypothetical protein